MKLEPGSVILTPDEVAVLRRHIERWEDASRIAGADSATPLAAIGMNVRDLLTQASDDERKPMIR
jgi:hypothetical protein